jgi:hypothetical protein
MARATFRRRPDGVYEILNQGPRRWPALVFIGAAIVAAVLATVLGGDKAGFAVAGICAPFVVATALDLLLRRHKIARRPVPLRPQAPPAIVLALRKLHDSRAGG